MAEDTIENNDVSLSAVIEEQSQTIQTLVEQVSKDVAVAPGGSQPIYNVTPQPRATSKPPNYLMLAGIAFGAWFFLKRR